VDLRSTAGVDVIENHSDLILGEKSGYFETD
jgi:hypothetical protein